MGELSKADASSVLFVQAVHLRSALQHLMNKNKLNIKLIQLTLLLYVSIYHTYGVREGGTIGKAVHFKMSPTPPARALADAW